MKLYQEIILLKHLFKGKWVVENVESYYVPLIRPTTFLDRHFFWANFQIPFIRSHRGYSVVDAHHTTMSKHIGIDIPKAVKNKRLLFRNAVDPKIGLHIFEAGLRQTVQESLL